MGNRLKDVFNSNQVQNNLRVLFKDGSAGQKFAEALQKLYETGEPQKIEGVERITAGCSDGAAQYAREYMTDLLDMRIYPNKQEKAFPVQTKYGEQSLVLDFFSIQGGVVVETKEDFPVHARLVFDRETERCHFTVQYKPARAEGIEQLVKAYASLYVYLQNTFCVKEEDREYHQWSAICKQFEFEIAFFEKVWEIEKKLGQSFDTSYMTSVSDEEWRECVSDVEQLYRALILGKAVRLPARLNATESTCVYLEKGQPAELGGSIELTFTGTVQYQIFGEEITLYTANLLCDAVVKQVICEEADKRMKILYGDTDSRPMYIAYTVHMTEEAAQRENKQLMEHASFYREAE